VWWRFFLLLLCCSVVRDDVIMFLVLCHGGALLNVSFLSDVGCEVFCIYTCHSPHSNQSLLCMMPEYMRRHSTRFSHYIPYCVTKVSTARHWFSGKH
jgi:hypothetical protein